VTGPSWLAGVLAVVMILVAASSACRLGVSRLRGLATEADADGIHVLMGTAMAGMLMPQLNPLPGNIWVAVFGIGAAWFGASAVRARARARVWFSWQCRFPVPHLIECVAMLYMLLSAPSAQHEAGAVMPGMSTSASAPAGFPALSVVLALFMLGYLMWTTDQLASLVRTTPRSAVPARSPEKRALVAVPASGRPARMASSSAADSTRPASLGTGRPLMAPKLAACGKIAMSIAMACMLILML
jgi:Domain of unknown function (DUF5134)